MQTGVSHAKYDAPVHAPQWRLQILASVKRLLRDQGFRGSKTVFYKVIGDRRIMVQPVGGSDPNNTQKLEMQVFLGVDFLTYGEEPATTAYTALWTCELARIDDQGMRDTFWQATSDAEAQAVHDGILNALPGALDQIERKFQTWHDVLPYLDREGGRTLDPPGMTNAYKLPKV